ncbi:MULTISPECIES: ArsR/SmtB family transcription factor [Thiomicrorhabdus]|uniref:Helix-turn-helix transcriptional regulator n=1 Tax=Thiomicrorhabdus heinhorstiae TaxID=2748010 RepID=A0ABS0BXS5_9GAMM|nr:MULTISPECIES: metalloregulator ArsR/SmtB family transcription factor [Thiomicrorhabdus]MBF6057651.1 helix-turn-helix transcriptional regulator [Thiomicrorhabdus heinhorstiae]
MPENIPSLDDYSQIFKALSEPMRLRILNLLMQRESLCVCQLVEHLQAGQSLISRHLSYLKNTGWVDSYRQGAWMHYQINEERLDTINSTLFKSLLSQFDESREDLQRLQSENQAIPTCQISR